jgi:broad specificity phosphatase PhoE
MLDDLNSLKLALREICPEACCGDIEPVTTRVIVVRHGKSSYNLERRIQGRLDLSILTDQGRETARLVADALQGIPFDGIYCSPLQRAKETATIIQSILNSDPAAPPLQPSDNLIEIDLPLWEGMLRQEAIDKFPEDYQCWQERPHEFRMVLADEAGSRDHFPVLAVYEQASRFWQELLTCHSGGTVLIVAHNGINRALISTALQLSPAYYHSIQQSNCGISVLNFADVAGTPTRLSPIQLESMNLTSHAGEKFPSLRDGHQGVRLLLVRHGETEWNRQGRFQGQIDVPLNDNGRAQARKAGEFLKDIQIDFAVSSSMLRPKETAELILEHHPQVELKLSDQMREISHGLWEGKFETEIEQEYPGLLQQWKDAPETVQMPEGENLQQVWERAIAAWRSIVETAQPGTTGLVVGHDAINKAILCHLFNLSPEHFWTFKQGNGGVTVIDYPKGANGLPVLQAMNITTHLSGSVLDKTAAGAL